MKYKNQRIRYTGDMTDIEFSASHSKHRTCEFTSKYVKILPEKTHVKRNMDYIRYAYLYGELRVVCKIKYPK